MKSMAIFKCVCDRCKKDISSYDATSFLKMQTERVGSRIRIKGSYLLCDKCAEDFTDRFINGYTYEADEVKEKREDISMEKLPALFFDLSNYPVVGFSHGKLLKVPASIVDTLIRIATDEEAKGGDNDA